MIHRKLTKSLNLESFEQEKVSFKGKFVYYDGKKTKVRFEDMNKEIQEFYDFKAKVEDLFYTKEGLELLKKLLKENKEPAKEG